MISYVLPTRNRHDTLALTLRELEALPRHDAQLIIVDNASDTPVTAPQSLPNGVSVSVIQLRDNQGTGARNVGVSLALQRAGSHDHWIVMLDDDSSPISLDFLPVLQTAARDEAVIAAEVLLSDTPDGRVRHEAGGLPEVFIGCGAAIRAEAWNAVGGYDLAFDYYAEEYDFSARLLRAGLRVRYDRRFLVRHRKVSEGRDMNRIIGNLVRNNAWVMARYAPTHLRDELVQHQIDRYAAIARKENALPGYTRGLDQLRSTLTNQPHTPLDAEQWNRFIGYTAAHETLSLAAPTSGSVAIVDAGKNVEVITQAARDIGMQLTDDSTLAQTLLIGTLSPGPMLDAHAARKKSPLRVLMPWTMCSTD
ncbi:MAG TPA: glycosyltransferase [Phycisphaerales bacterium]|nr:glycosyltransferase [Phycisphaerales bacterium]